MKVLAMKTHNHMSKLGRFEQIYTQNQDQHRSIPSSATQFPTISDYTSRNLMTLPTNYGDEEVLGGSNSTLEQWFKGLDTIHQSSTSINGLEMDR